MGKIARQLTQTALIAEYLSPNVTLALGGLHFHNTPMALVREVIRQQIPVATLVPPLDGSINADQLIGAGLVAEVQVAYLGAEIFGLAPRFRAAVESGRIAVRDCEEAGFTLAVQAGAAGLPFAALPPGFFPESDGVPTAASVNSHDYRTVSDPFSGRPTRVVRAIRPDVALLHCQVVDAAGNCGFLGAEFLDCDIARAARVCLVQAERAVESLPADCRTVLPSYVVDAYCVVSGGAHPGASHGCYTYDDTHIGDYINLAATDEGFSHYRNAIIGPDEDAYRIAVDIETRLTVLKRVPS